MAIAINCFGIERLMSCAEDLGRGL
ncbi:uncharacterized protein METZ01_LOCUS186041 [marine metagenome]|uniref:Uncharacterized protein n=1 Tax=marine metagenome TaxID=408172 RepID=A0A382D6G0_9ZZZZ